MAAFEFIVASLSLKGQIGNTQFVTIEGIKYDAGIDIQSPNAMIGMHIKTPSIPLFVEGGNYPYCGWCIRSYRYLSVY